MTSKKLKPTQSYVGLDTAGLDAVAADVGSRLNALREQMAQLSAQCQQLMVDQEAIADERATRKLAAQGPLDWPWLLAGDPENSGVRYKAAKQAIRQFAEYQGHVGLSAEGINVHTNQHVPRVALLRGEPVLTRQVQRGLEQMLPCIEPCVPGHRQEDKVKYIAVFEATLSEFGGFYLAINEARELYELRKKRYGQQAVFAATTLGELLDYVEQHCYYEDWTERKAA